MKSTFQAFRRILAWVVAQPTLMALPMVAAFITQLEAVLDGLSGAAAAQDTHLRMAKGATAEKRGIRRDVVEQMRLVASVAEISIPDVVKVTAALRMRRGKKDTEGLVTAGLAMADAAEAHQATLVKQGLVADVIAQLRASAQQLKVAIDSRGQLVAQRRGATADVDLRLGQARKLVDAITILVTRALRDDPSKIAEWEQLKRVVQKSGGRPATGREAPVTPATPVTPVTPAVPEEVKAA